MLRTLICLAMASTVSAPALAQSGNGSLKVTSYPSGAEVQVDGVPTGKVTPMSVSLAQGEHTVTVSIPNPGWNPDTRTVTIVSGNNDLSVTLLPTLTTGPQGPPGPQGLQGPAGPVGPIGPSNIIYSGSTGPGGTPNVNIPLYANHAPTVIRAITLSQGAYLILGKAVVHVNAYANNSYCSLYSVALGEIDSAQANGVTFLDNALSVAAPLEVGASGDTVYLACYHNHPGGGWARDYRLFAVQSNQLTTQ